MNAANHGRRRKLDNIVQKKMQQGRDPMDVGTVGRWSKCGDASGEYHEDGVYAVGFKGKGKGKVKRKGECYSCGGPGHLSRDRPCPQKGKSKGTTFQGYRLNCGEIGRLVLERPKGKGTGKSRSAWSWWGMGKGDFTGKGT